MYRWFRIGKSVRENPSIVTESLLAFGVGLLFVPRLVPRFSELLGIGVSAAIFIAGFDVALARGLRR